MPNPNIPPKPEPLAVKPGSIPEALRILPHWVNWRYAYRKDKWTKPLFQPNGDPAESDNSKTWVSFDEAISAYLRGGFEGIGFVVSHEDTFAGVDLDHCRDPETGALQPWATQIVQRINSYTEISPSGTGVRILLHAKLPPKDRKIGNFECYESGRYFTITGTHLPGTPHTIEPRQEEMLTVHTQMFAERNKPRDDGRVNTSLVFPNLEDEEVLERAFNAKNGEAIWRLFHGDIVGYGSHSEADMALCGHLAFYTGPDPQKIDRLYRASDLVSPKWDDPRGDTTWGRMTIEKVLDGRTEFYSPNGNHAGEPPQPEAPWPSLSPPPEKPIAPTLLVDMIPEPYRPWILDVARQACFPPEMVVVPALVGTASIIGRKLWVRPWRFTDSYVDI